ncbi:hypothetical protein ACFPM0_23880 [Pseudonocardia sulfidoxydans]
MREALDATPGRPRLAAPRQRPSGSPAHTKLAASSPRSLATVQDELS